MPDSSTLHWWLHTDAGLAARIGIGVAMFAAFAIVELRRKGWRKATRWREYAFLLACVIAAMTYGVVNDLLTATISWEYYFYGKGLADVMEPLVPPRLTALYPRAALVGMKATWSVGLIVGVALLFANNPSALRPPLPYRTLSMAMVIVLLCAAGCAALLGIVGYFGGLVRFSSDFREMVRFNEFRPYGFMSVFGIHLGGYIGGALGAILSVCYIRLKRRTESQATPSENHGSL